MNVIFNPYQLIKEELLKEKPIALQERILVHEEKPILAQDESESIVGFDEARESLAMDDSSLKDPIQMGSMLKLWRFKKKKKKSLPRFNVTKEENEILFDLEEKEIESNPSLEGLHFGCKQGNDKRVVYGQSILRHFFERTLREKLNLVSHISSDAILVQDVIGDKWSNCNGTTGLGQRIGPEFWARELD
ncbi:hypothetical protein Cgig2_034107 [Carnegiea gigantea]|uniref:Uncharacterized protein n=1 Tax=Carnegiea gigantea TaxID=171969 RepID=A0A9Q1K1Q0_9CARY|nr:hypothetical protein Cgig2_034107 [Carnegiea gigantea]